LEQRLTVDNYLNYLTNELPHSTEEVPLDRRSGIFRQRDGAPPQFGRQVTPALRKLLDWSSWSNNLAAEISGPNPALFLFMGFNERDYPQDQSTDKRENPASDYGSCCLHRHENTPK
jgi:hypothetical protein